VEGTCGRVGDVDAGVGSGEEDIDCGSEENGAESADSLGEPLVLRRGAEEEADAEVAS
jgi:hypothetical protein